MNPFVGKAVCGLLIVATLLFPGLALASSLRQLTGEKSRWEKHCDSHCSVMRESNPPKLT